jgi:uncharacterized SAM-binding protein YcdF (DUF218 family)
MRIQTITFRICAAIGMLTLICLALAAAMFPFLARWLNVPDPELPSDAIVVLAGAPERAMYAADLLVKDYAPVAYVSRPARERGHLTLAEFGIILPTEEEVNRAILKSRGVKESRICIFSRGSREESRAIRETLPADTATVIVVTSPYHVRRVKMIFNEAFGGSAITIRVVATPYEIYPDRWWTNRDAATQTILEIIKIGVYRMGIE